MDDQEKNRLKVTRALMALRERNSRCVRGLYDAVVNGLPSNSTRRYREAVAALPQLSRDIYCVLALDDEVRNGGFNQYFYDDPGYFVQEAIAAFERFGEAEVAAAVRKAVDIYQAEMPLQRQVRDAKSLEAFAASYAESKLGDADHVYSETIHIDRLLEKIAHAIRSAE